MEICSNLKDFFKDFFFVSRSVRCLVSDPNTDVYNMHDLGSQNAIELCSRDLTPTEPFCARTQAPTCKLK